MARHEQDNSPEQVEAEMQKIEQQIAQLKQYETDRHSDLVDEAVGITRDLLAKRMDWMNAHGIVATIHGSMQYHDPRNLDTDIGLHSSDYPYDAEELHEIEQDFLNLTHWPRPKTRRSDPGEICPLDITYGSLALMRENLDEQLSNGLPYDYDEDFAIAIPNRMGQKW
jgi:hypothetical protein